MWVSVGFLCSRNAHDRKVLAGLMAHLGVPVGRRVRRLCAVGGQTGHPPVKKTSELGGIRGDGA